MKQNKLKEYREKKKYSQEEMAEALGITLRAYRNYEQGVRRIPYGVLAKFLYIRNEGNDRELSAEIWAFSGEEKECEKE